MSWGDSMGADPDSGPRLDLDDLLTRATRAGASDLHLTVGAPPTMRMRAPESWDPVRFTLDPPLW